jgi:glycogen operon protein
MYVIMNAYWEPLEFELPTVEKGRAGVWRRWIDTSLESPRDIVPWQAAASLPDQTYRAAARTVVVLFRELGRGEIPS